MPLNAMAGENPAFFIIQAMGNFPRLQSMRPVLKPGIFLDMIFFLIGFFRGETLKKGGPKAADVRGVSYGRISITSRPVDFLNP